MTWFSDRGKQRPMTDYMIVKPVKATQGNLKMWPL